MPTIPGTACKEKQSRTSSTPCFLRNLELKNDAVPAIAPTRAAAWGPTNPDPGVIAASPASVPLRTSVIENILEVQKEAISQTNAEKLADICVLTSAYADWSLAASAEPPLKLYHPAQMSTVPIRVSVKLEALPATTSLVYFLLSR